MAHRVVSELEELFEELAVRQHRIVQILRVVDTVTPAGQCSVITPCTGLVCPEFCPALMAAAAQTPHAGVRMASSSRAQFRVWVRVSIKFAWVHS